jgi:nucleotide-binding universal stress UspA family protein
MNSMDSCVVVATDGSPASTAAVEWAADEAAARKSQLLIFTACPPVAVPASAGDTATVALMSEVLDTAEMRRKEYREVVDHAADRARGRHPDLAIRTEVFDGDARRALELYEREASIVVVGSRGLGSVRTVLLGSVSFWATRHLSVPIAVIRPSDGERLSVPHRIAVGIASETNSEITLREAFAMASRRGCPLTIANAYWDSEAPGTGWKQMSLAEVDAIRYRAVTELAEQIGKDYPGVVFRVMFARGRVDGFLASLGHSHDALVLGRRTSTLLDFVGLGTLASAVVEHAVGATVIVPVERGH